MLPWEVQGEAVSLARRRGDEDFDDEEEPFAFDEEDEDDEDFDDEDLDEEDLDDEDIEGDFDDEDLGDFDEEEDESSPRRR